MSRKEAIRALAKDFVKFVTKEENKDGAFDAWYAKFQADLAKQIQYELEQLNAPKD